MTCGIIIYIEGEICLRIKMPNGYNIFLTYSPSYDKRLEVIKNILFDYKDKKWIKWLEKTWLSKRYIGKSNINMPQYILDKCATFLLKGCLNGDILDERKELKIRQTEIPMSNILADTDEHENNENIKLKGSIEKTIYDKNISELNKNINKKKKKKRVSNTFSKINKLYSTRLINTYRVIPVLEIKDGKKLIKKTIDGKPILIDEKFTIGGNIGPIEENCIYIARWCIVNTYNEFYFMGKKYVIDESIKQYLCDIDDDNKSEMDRILCYYFPKNNQYLFFDQNICPIDNELILGDFYEE